MQVVAENAPVSSLIIGRYIMCSYAGWLEAKSDPSLEFVVEMRILAEMNVKILEKYFFCGKKSTSILFFL